MLSFLVAPKNERAVTRITPPCILKVIRLNIYGVIMKQLLHFPFYIGDYLKDTMAFTQEERGAYIDLCVAYIQNDGKLKDDETLYLLTRCFSEQNRTTVATVVERAFERKDGFIISNTLNVLINKQKKLYKQKVDAGKQSAKKRAKIQRSFQQSESESESKPESKTSTKVIKPPEEKETNIPDWIPKEPWEEFMKVREKLKAKNTDYAKKVLINSLAKMKEQGHCPTDIINTSILNSWKGVFAPNNTNQKNNQPKPTKTKEEAKKQLQALMEIKT